MKYQGDPLIALVRGCRPSTSVVSMSRSFCKSLCCVELGCVKGLLLLLQFLLLFPVVGAVPDSIVVAVAGDVGVALKVLLFVQLL